MISAGSASDHRDTPLPTPHDVSKARPINTFPPPPEPKQPRLSTGGWSTGVNQHSVERTAPPGRCHSCNMTTMTGWRRRPLCNTCRLGFAKQGRKLKPQETPIRSQTQPLQISARPTKRLRRGPV